MSFNPTPGTNSNSTELSLDSIVPSSSLFDDAVLNARNTSPTGASKASLSQISNLYVFGDAVSDTGNLSSATSGRFPSQPFVNGRFSNGPIWVDYLADELGLEENSSTNFAFAGATSGANNVGDPRIAGDLGEQLGLPGVLAQVEQFTNTTPNADPNGLYTILIGADDYLAGQTDPTVPVNNIVSAVRSLADAGARNILVSNLPDLSRLPDVLSNPFPGDLSGLIEAHNANLAQALQQLDQTLDPQVNLVSLDLATLFTETLTNSERSGFTNTTDPYFTESPNNSITFAEGDPNDFAFFGRYHPSTVTHRLITESALSALLDSGAEVPEQFGTAEADIICGDSEGDRILGLAGNDQIGGGSEADILLGGEGDDRLKGNDGDNVLWGEVGDDILMGGLGQDQLNGGQGSNHLIGNSGQDTFILNRNGLGIIQDFQDGQDRLELSGTLQFSDLNVTQQGAETVIMFSGNELARLPGVAAESITIADFTP